MPAKPLRPILIRGNIALIPLTRGLTAIIDADDVPLVEGRHWRARPCRHIMYAATSIVRNGKRTTLGLHQLILPLPKGLLVDHADRDGLNCRRYNLRASTPTQNQMNQARSTFNTSGVKGVNWSKERQKWHAQIKVEGRNKHVGYFASVDDARAAREEAERRYYGEFARVG